MTRSALLCCALLGSAPFLGCSFVNDRRPCDDLDVHETLLNERQDQEEFLNSAHPLVAVDDTRAFTAFIAQKVVDDVVQSSSVRYGMLSLASGSVSACQRAQRDCDVVDADASGELARGAAVARAPLPIELDHAAALLAWIDGGVVNKTYARMRFFDAGGSPLGQAGVFDPFGQPMQALDIAWSEQAERVLLVAQDNRDLWMAWIDRPGKTTPIKIASGNDAPGVPVGIVDVPSVAVAPDGRALVAWFDTADGFKTLALTPEGEPAGNPTLAGLPGAIVAPRQGAPSAIAVGSDRFALVGSCSTTSKDGPLRSFVQEFSFDGAPLSDARQVDPDDDGQQTQPSAIYLPRGTLLVTWHSATRRGVVGRLFDAGGAPRFCALGCNEGPFAVGARMAGTAANNSALLRNGDDVWIAHDGADARGEGIYLLRAPFGTLYPAKP